MENQANMDTKKLVLISFDGFRPDYINGQWTPFLQHLSQRNVLSIRMKSTFPTKTASNHFSIATGCYSEVHGIINTKMFDPRYNETFSWANKETKWWDSGSSLPIWLANEIGNDGRYSGVWMWPGSDVIIRGRKARFVQPYDESIEWTEAMETMISWLVDLNSEVNFIAAYFNQPDKLAHKFGPFSEIVIKKITEIDDFMKKFFKKLEEKHLLERTDVIILSDHGMAEITQDRVIELSNLMDLTTFKMFGSATVWNVQPNEGFEDQVYDTFEQLSRKYAFKVYKKDEIPERYHYKNCDRILDILLEADEGYEIRERRKEKPSKVWGNHGYDNGLESMRPLFIASGPNFKSNYIHGIDFMNIDLYPLMVRLLNIESNGQFTSNGSIKNVIDMLIK